ncbi:MULTISPECIES: AlpA family transcriptional regulator [Enterobacteriaceae]|jgi:predicted DNA-binding transcriptional regulator AlpA|uniref:helix-turn-helix transcriptional regulator n=1 Tax=Enterobacter TaxID=547 RepID=UPI000C78CA3F|nr:MULTISPECIES: AlpA family phage regulatory protein [Enterobacteriaceae]EGS1686339.1 AlpA family phage regulatory protein [Enterobacter cloacae]AUM05036.1 AlpA family phage regulatory protein [Enterobacter sp. Crenshaw]MBJ9874021.1 AlpA family phage regulatory protein [Citrobacter werkmanii]MDU2377636.1 AlpA family phage regulatory protein [Enterobacter cloacae]MDU2519715.1 AlpA family phage regulatory protein [Enterobacter cloacae]
MPASAPVNLLSDQMVDMKFITAFTGLTDKWFYKLIKEKKFPKPIKLGRASRWFKSEVEKWLKERIEESREEEQPEEK